MSKRAVETRAVSEPNDDIGERPVVQQLLEMAINGNRPSSQVLTPLNLARPQILLEFLQLCHGCQYRKKSSEEAGPEATVDALIYCRMIPCSRSEGPRAFSASRTGRSSLNVGFKSARDRVCVSRRWQLTLPSFSEIQLKAWI